MKFKFSIPFLLLAAISLSCDNDEVKIDSGSADLSHYISIGNSLTAGFADGGLYRESQLNSYPAILAKQFGVSFSQPLMPEGNGSGYVYLTSYVNGIPGFNNAKEDPAAFNKVTGKFNNLGIPGLRVRDIDNPGLGLIDENRYFHRIVAAGKETNFTYLELLENSDHTFFTCWLGNNDILGYALDGGVFGIEGEGELHKSGLTPVSEFSQKYGLLMDKLLVNDAKGVLMTLPDISQIPYFNLVSNDDFPSLDEEWLNSLNEIYHEYNEAISKYNEEIENNTSLSSSEKEALFRDEIKFSLNGPNAFVIVDNQLPGDEIKDKEGNPYLKIRQLNEGEKITLDGVFEIIDFTKLAGIQSPLNDQFILTQSELDLIQDYKEAYNDIIRSYQANQHIEVIESGQLLQAFVNGKIIDGEEISTQFIEGGFFSLDGVHLTQKGYAIVSNSIIETINQSFSAAIPKVNVSQFKGVNIP